MKKTEIRQNKVLNALIEEYIHNCETVSSKLICENYVPNASPATIRIDLNKLEKERYIIQPHTSAGRIPTIKGFRRYIEQISSEVETVEYDKAELLRELLIKHYKNTPLALHYIMQMLAKETDQLSFVAEPEVSYGYLEKLDVFKIAEDKLLFVVSLDSGIDKTVILKCDNGITPHQLKAIVRYANEEFVGHRIYDIQNRYLDESFDKVNAENNILRNFFDELQNALTEISSFFIHFDGSITFLEQPEFNDKSAILSFLGFVQRQDQLVKTMQEFDYDKDYNVVMGEDFGDPQLAGYALVYSRYEIFGIPGYLGVLGPVRMDYKQIIPIVREFSKIITETTKKGMVVPKHG